MTTVIIPTYDVGSAVLLEVAVKKAIPFADPVSSDPTELKITVTDPKGTVVVDAQDMAQKTDENDAPVVGEWYYICQTELAWDLGPYNVRVHTSDGTYKDETVYKKSFKLI